MKTIQVSDEFVESLRNIVAELRHARRMLPMPRLFGITIDTASQMDSAIGGGIAAIETILWGIDKPDPPAKKENGDKQDGTTNGNPT